MNPTPAAISRSKRKRLTRVFLCAPLVAGAWLAPLLAAETRGSGAPVRYEVDLRQPATHRAAVTMTVPKARPRTRLQFPAWNALYQIRDFVRKVEGLIAACDGAPVELERLDLHTWRSGERTCEQLEIRYRVYANEEGPFSSAVNSEHAFLNLAMVLFYLPDHRDKPARVRFWIPEGWRLATLLEEAEGEFRAVNYDELVDSPIEAGTFREHEFVEGGALYRIVVHAMAESYNENRLLNSLRKIVRATTELMQDVPFRRFTFLIHFRPDATGAAMEHRDGTALDSSTGFTWESFQSLAAHEFLHAWIVKRIRPARLEPVDYVHGNDTRDLWFAEGLVSAYQRYVLLRVGLISENEFYRQLAGEITRLEQRPARRSLSVEQAGLEAWLEKYPEYLRPERSISYYNKGAIVSFLLDFAVRHSTENRQSLDDVLRRLNEEFARQGRYFTREDLVGAIRRVAPEFQDVEDFFNSYIEGTRDLDYEPYLGYAGLRLVTKTEERASVGFTTTRGFGGPATVDSVNSEGAAAQAGLAVGDELVSIGGRRVPRWPDEEFARLRPGRTLRVRVRRGGRELDIEFPVGWTQVTTYRIEEKRGATSLEREIRRGILTGAVSAAAEVEVR